MNSRQLVLNLTSGLHIFVFFLGGPSWPCVPLCCNWFVLLEGNSGGSINNGQTRTETTSLKSNRHEITLLNFFLYVEERVWFVAALVDCFQSPSKEIKLPPYTMMYVKPKIDRVKFCNLELHNSQISALEKYWRKSQELIFYLISSSISSSERT